MTTLRKSLSDYEREIASTQIFNSLRVRPEMKRAQRICMYISLPEEVDTKKILAIVLSQKKDVILPRVVSHSSMKLHRIQSFDDLTLGLHGIKEPKETCAIISAHEVDLFVVPGVAFDREGYRLGRGKGYYDRLLSRAKATKIGLAFSCQIVSRLPRERYDIPMDVVITESGSVIPAAEPGSSENKTGFRVEPGMTEKQHETLTP